LILTGSQGLASFTAHLCRRYSQIDPTPVLQFIVHRLLEDSPPDAIILRELVSKMSGVDPLQMLADNQVAAMGGGPILQTETVASETRGALQTKPLQRSADKLLSVMYSANLMLPMLVLLARLSQQCVYSSNPNEAILKGLGSTFDDVTTALPILEPRIDVLLSCGGSSFNTSRSCHFHRCHSDQLPRK
jgi:THO complex subunit 2